MRAYFLYNISMKVWVYKIISVLLSALVVWASAGTAFAQKQLKYVPKALKAAPKIKIPYAVNPQLPPAARANFAMPLVRPNVSAQMDRVVTQKAAQTPRKMPNKRAPKKTPQQIIDAFEKWVAKHPGTSPRQKIRRGGKLLSLTELRKRTEQGDTQAAELADELELGQAIGIALQNWPKTWPKEYQELKALYDANRNKKTPQQVIAAYKQWVAKHPGSSPRKVIGEDGKNLSLTELRKRAEYGDTQAAELADELELGQAINNAQRTWPEDSPEYQELDALYNQNRNTKTPQQVISAYKQWITKHPGTSPRQAIEQNGNKLSLAELRKRAEQGDAQSAELADELELGQAIGMALQSWSKDLPMYQKLKALYEENRNRSANKPTEELYKDLVAHIKDYGHYPLWNERTLYTNLYNRLRRYQSTMVDGKYADPWLQKIYELKTLIQNAPEGKFTLTPDGQGGYTLEIEEPVAEELDLSAPQKEEEVAPAVPSRHALYEHITEDIKNMILQARDQAALQRHEFYPWLRNMQQNHLDQIVNKDTSDALWALNRAISFDYKTGQNRRAVTYLLQTINNYVGILGVDEERGYFNKIIYRGKLEPGMLPQADLFHVVAEQEGMSWNGDVVPQVGDVNKAYAQAIKRGENPGVFLDGDENMVTAIGIAPRVPLTTVKQDLENMIQQLLPPGFEVRMGLHELGISGNNLTKFRKGHLHIHLERPATTEEMQDGFLTDVSISLNIKADRFVRKYNKTTQRVEARTDKEIAQNYLTLFGSFLDQAAKDKLNELIR